MALQEELNARIESSEALATVLGDWMLADHLGGAFGCAEVETLAEFVRAWGGDAGAEAWLDAHALKDEEEDDHYERGEKIRADIEKEGI